MEQRADSCGHSTVELNIMSFYECDMKAIGRIHTVEAPSRVLQSRPASL